MHRLVDRLAIALSVSAGFELTDPIGHDEIGGLADRPPS
jgi:hypothetical protein